MNAGERPELSGAGPEAAQRWAIVADDLTGAADSAVGFADAGHLAAILLDGFHAGETAEIETLLQQPEPPEVLVTSTGVRGAAEAEAEDRTRGAVRAMRELGATRLFLKIDSAGRGPIAAEIAGALSAWSQGGTEARAVVCPAYPHFGRQVIGGQLLINGAPLADSATAQDPVSPRDEGDLTVVIPGAQRAAFPDRDPVRLAIVDAENDGDLHRIAGGLAAAPPEVIAVGSGGLAAALGREVGTLAGPTEVTIDAVEREAPADPASVSDDRPARTVVAVSSQHPISLAQVRKLTAAGLPDTEIVLPQVPGEISLEAAVADFVHRVRAAVRRPGDLDLVLVGGDGAGVILDALGAKALVVRRTLIDGCPLSTILGGDADGMRVVTKSGGFGTAETLVDIVGRLRRPGQRA